MKSEQGGQIVFGDLLEPHSRPSPPHRERILDLDTIFAGEGFDLETWTQGGGRE